MAAPAAPAAASLEALLCAEIGAHGPITVERFMALALGHEQHGYYTAREPLGAAGDFVTAPEVGQAFGEIVGLWLAEAWAALGRPDPVRLVELGPGRGTLMTDLLRAAAKVPRFTAAIRVHLVETSQRLRARQRGQLPHVGATWHDTFDQVPEGPLLLIANELFDALPVRQLQFTAAGWVERRIGLDDYGRLAFTVDATPATLTPDVPATGRVTLGKITEVSAARSALAAAIGARLAEHGGLALVIDYGAWVDGPTGDTLQAVRDHAPVAPLAAPGLSDLSTQVDFRALGNAAAAGGAAVYGPVPQGPFLRAFGIDLRTAQLLRRASPEQSRLLRAALFRLTDASAMGELFKVLVLSGPGDPPPPGFSAPTLTPRSISSTDLEPCRPATEPL